MLLGSRNKVHWVLGVGCQLDWVTHNSVFCKLCRLLLDFPLHVLYDLELDRSLEMFDIHADFCESHKRVEFNLSGSLCFEVCFRVGNSHSSGFGLMFFIEMLLHNLMLLRGQ